MVSMGSFLDVSNWLNPAKLTLYSQTNSSTQWIQDFCGQRTTEPCEQICEQDTGKSTFRASHDAGLKATSPFPRSHAAWNIFSFEILHWVLKYISNFKCFVGRFRINSTSTCRCRRGIVASWKRERPHQLINVLLQNTEEQNSSNFEKSVLQARLQYK